MLVDNDHSGLIPRPFERGSFPSCLGTSLVPRRGNRTSGHYRWIPFHSGMQSMQINDSAI